MTSSREPKKIEPKASWSHFELYTRVQDALLSLPFNFKTETYIEGITATDIFTLNSALGATIENQVVDTLNHMRTFWDPADKYLNYSFVRQAQTFPDVVLRKNVKEGTEEDIIMGIELKGWYLLAKEAEPSFRFQATPEACAVQDLIVVVPWVLNNVMSGSPKVMRPYIESSRYAAEYRNYHWEHLREIKGDKAQAKVTLATGVSPYPKKSDQISDKPVSDSGGNFGRYARTGLMDTYKSSIMQEDICGIEATHWLNFFKLFQDNQDSAKIAERITALRTKITASKAEQKSIAIKILDVIEDNT